jgi:hypothetical protein
MQAGQGASITLTILFSEAVIGFIVADVAVSGGTLGAMTANADQRTYTVPVTMGVPGAVIISIGAGAGRTEWPIGPATGLSPRWSLRRCRRRCVRSGPMPPRVGWMSGADQGGGIQPTPNDCAVSVQHACSSLLEWPEISVQNDPYFMEMKWAILEYATSNRISTIPAFQHPTFPVQHSTFPCPLTVRRHAGHDHRAAPPYRA